METNSASIDAMPIAELKAHAKKFSARAMNLKMELHDLSEELPTGWERIPDVARRAHDAFAALAQLREVIAASGG